MARITKKEKLRLLKKDLYDTLILAMGYMVDGRGYIIDQDTNNVVVMDGKPLRRSIFCHNGEIPFDPIDNIKLASRLFTSFIQKDSIENGTYYRLWNDDTKQAGNRITCSLSVDSDSGPYKTLYYQVEPLKYIEIIFTISGMGYTGAYLKENYDIDEFNRRLQ